MNSQRTNQVRAVRWLSTLLLFGAIFTLLCPAGAWAVGTPSGTTISNQATIDYAVGGVSQTAIDSAATDFLVDNRIDVTVASGTSFANWRAGWTNLGPEETYTTSWIQVLPDLGSLTGENLFTLTAADVTPAPYNQPPYAPSGDTAVDACTVTGLGR